MSIFAVLNGTTVQNVIVADDKTECEKALNCVLVEITQENPAGPDWVYDPDTGRFVAPMETPIEDE